MIRQVFDVNNYWKVTVYYDFDGDFFFPVLKELERIGVPYDKCIQILKALLDREAVAVTCSSGDIHESIVVFGIHQTMKDYLDSIVHEAEHIKQDMLHSYHIEDSGEPPAYTIGYLVSRMYEVFRKFICG